MSRPQAGLFLQQWLQELSPGRVGGRIDHSLQANVLVRPHGPVRLIAVVDLQLVAQDLVAHGISVRISHVDRPELAYPDRCPRLPHVGRASQKRLLQDSLIHILSPRDARIRTPIDEAREGVVMHAVNDLRPRLRKHVEFCRVTIAFQKEDVIGIDGADGLVEPPIEGYYHLFTGITRLIDRVVASHPGIPLVTIGVDLPEVNCPILKVLMLPEQGFVGWVVAMPGLILIARQGVQVDDCVYLLFATQVDYTVQVLKALFLDDKRLHIRLEMAIVDGEPQKVEAKGHNELSIVAFEEIFQEAIEEEFISVIAKHLADGLSLSFLIGRKARNEVLHVHPPAQTKAAQQDLLAFAVDNGRPLCSQNICWHKRFPLVFSLPLPFVRKIVGYLLKPAIKPASNWRLPKM